MRVSEENQENLRYFFLGFITSIITILTPSIAGYEDNPGDGRWNAENMYAYNDPDWHPENYTKSEPYTSGAKAKGYWWPRKKKKIARARGELDPVKKYIVQQDYYIPTTHDIFIDIHETHPKRIAEDLVVQSQDGRVTQVGYRLSTGEDIIIQNSSGLTSQEVSHELERRLSEIRPTYVDEGLVHFLRFKANHRYEWQAICPQYYEQVIVRHMLRPLDREQKNNVLSMIDEIEFKMYTRPRGKHDRVGDLNEGSVKYKGYKKKIKARVRVNPTVNSPEACLDAARPILGAIQDIINDVSDGEYDGTRYGSQYLPGTNELLGDELVNVYNEDAINDFLSPPQGGSNGSGSPASSGHPTCTTCP